MENFKPLKFISSLFYILGWAVSIIAIIIFISLLFELSFLYATCFLFGGLLSGVFMFLISYLITLMLKIEDNTRKTAKIFYMLHQETLDAKISSNTSSGSAIKSKQITPENDNNEYPNL